MQTMPSRALLRLASLSGLILLATLTASCQTTGSGGTSTLVACQSFKPVYWSRSDTPDTVAQIKENNAAGKALCGWGGAK